MDYDLIESILEDDVWYTVALVYVCVCAFGLGLCIGGVWILSI